MRHIICSAAIVLYLTACTNIQVRESISVEPTIGLEPSVGEISSAPVGGAILSQYKIWKKTGLKLDERVMGTVGGAPVDVSTSEYLFKAVADSKEAYCTEKLTVKNFVGVGVKKTCFGGINTEGKVTKVMVPADAVWWIKDLPHPIGISKIEENIPQRDAFRNELVFLGSAGKVIRLLYREYTGDLIRPAFFQEVSYDAASLPVEISFRGAKFQVIELPGSSIKYRVLSSF